MLAAIFEQLIINIVINIYWPVFQNIERQFVELMFDIHIDDNQLNVYSLKISDLILRAAVEIESISKDLYLLNGGNKSQQIKYDEDAIKNLNRLWNLEKKIVIISSSNCFLSSRIIYPFSKKEKRRGFERLTYGWNNAYQNLKHDRANSLSFASVKYLFEIMAALFILNIYFKDEVFNLERNSQSTDFPVNLGSEIFSINMHKWFSYDGQDKYGKKKNFDECVYLTKMTDKSIEENKRVRMEAHQRQQALFVKHPKFIKYLEKNKIENYTGNNLMWDVLGQEDYIQIFNQSHSKDFSDVVNKTEYEGVLNKQQF